MFQTFRLHAALFEEIFDLRLCESQRDLVLLMFLRKLREIFMDLSDSLVVTFLAERIS